MKYLRLIITGIFLPVMITSCSKSDTTEVLEKGNKHDTVTVLSPVAKIKANTLLVKSVTFDTAITIKKGLKQYQIRYRNPNDQPMSVYILEVDLNNPELSIHASMPNNSSTFALQSVPRIAQFENADGNYVLAAVNADYFMADGSPWGAIIKKGVALKTTFENSKHSWFGIDKTGAPLLGAASTFAAAQPNLYTAIGGKEPLVEGGFGSYNENADRHPRTIVGYNDKKVVYIVVVDGRQASYSIGMTLTELTQLMLALGAKQAINLDGGGSATFVVKNHELNTFQVINKPSDVTPRSVANALTIVSTSPN